MPRSWGALLGLSLGLFSIPAWSVSLGPVPLQVLLVWFLFAWLLLKGGTSIGVLFTRRHWILVTSIVMWMFLKDTIDVGSFLRPTQVLTGIVLAILAAATIYDNRALRYSIVILGVVVASSGIVAIFQSFGFAELTWARTIYWTQGVRQPSGLETYPVAYAYSSVAISVFVFGSLFLVERDMTKRTNKIPWKIYMAIGTSALGGLLVSASRSGLLGVLTGIWIVLVYAKKTGRTGLIISVIVISTLLTAIIIVMPQSLLPDKLIGKFAETETDNRLGGNLELFWPLIKDNPFGIPGPSAAGSVFTLTASDAAISRLEYERVKAANAGYDPHNAFLTLAVHYGIPAAVILGVIYVSLIFSGRQAARYFRSSGCEYEACLLWVVLAACMAVLIHGMFHNASIALGEMRNWYWIGLALALIAKAERLKRVKSKYSSRGDRSKAPVSSKRFQVA